MLAAKNSLNVVPREEKLESEISFKPMDEFNYFKRLDMLECDDLGSSIPDNVSWSVCLIY